MNNHREYAPMRLNPGPSRRLAGFLLVTHTAAAIVVTLLPITWFARAGLILFLVLDLGYQAGAYLLRRVPWAVREAVWESDGGWTLTLGSGRQVEARLLPTSFVSTPLVVLNFRRDRWRPCSLVLTADSLDPDLLRRLRVRLRLARDAVSRAPDAAA